MSQPEPLLSGASESPAHLLMDKTRAARAAEGYPKFAFAALAGAGVYLAGFTLLQALGALFAKEAYLNEAQSILTFAVIAIWALCAAVGYVTLGLWMKKTRTIMSALGETVPDTWQIWASWFIPIYCYVGPLKAMDTLAKRSAVDTALGVWWILWLVAGFASIISSRVPAQPDLIIAASVAAAVAMFGSYGALVVIIRKVTDRVDVAAI